MAIQCIKSTTQKSVCANFAEVREAIIAAARETPEGERTEVTVELDQGEYRLTAPAVFDANEEPALARVDLTLCPKEGMRPVLTSAVRIDGRAFVPVKDKPYFLYQFEKGADGKYPVFRELYVGGRIAPLAKSEVFVHPFGFANRANKQDPENHKGIFVPENIARKLTACDLSGAEMTMLVEWEFATLRVKSVDFSDTAEKDGVRYVRVQFEDEYHLFINATNGCLDINARETYFANTPAFLTEPGSYAYDGKTGRLYYLPRPGEDPVQSDFRIPTLENLLVFRGMTNVTVKGLTFTGIGSRFICENGYCAEQANGEKHAAVRGYLPHAAIAAEHMRRFTLTGCTFREIGCNALQMKNGAINLRIYDNDFENIGMSAIFIGGMATREHAPANINISVRIENNLFRGIGYAYPAAVALLVGPADGLWIRHNTIEKTAYSAISVGSFALPSDKLPGELTNLRDTDISYNRITDFMEVLRDGAAIYAMGQNASPTHGGYFNFMHDNFCDRATMGNGTVRGYYLDGSSSNWEMYDNVVGGVGLPLFSQFHVPSQFTHHNYLHDNYSTVPVDAGNHAPWRDTVMERITYEKCSMDEMCEKYPVAGAIRTRAGAVRE